MNPRITTVLALAGLAQAAMAQTPSFAYSIQAPSSMDPGQTATITILCGFSPGVGQTVTTPIGPKPVLGLSSGAFNIAGFGGGSWSGVSLIAPYNFIGTTAGAIAGPSVTGVLWGNGFGGPFTTSTLNPTPLWSGTFTMGAATAGLTVNPVGLHGVWAGNPGEFAVEAVSTQTTGAQAVINVPPAPGAFALIGAWAMAARRRRAPVLQ